MYKDFQKKQKKFFGSGFVPLHRPILEEMRKNTCQNA